MISWLELWPLMLPLGGIVLVAGFVQSLLGFGYGLTALAMLPFLLDARKSHLIVSISGIPPLMLAAYAYRQKTMLKPLLISLFGAVLILPVGILVFKLVPLEGLVRLTGGAILFFAVLELIAPKQATPVRSSGLLCFLAGSVSGFLSGAVSIGGPPIVTFALRQGWSPESFRFFVTFFLLVQASLKVVGLASVGFLDAEIIQLCSWSIPFALLGVYLGTIVARHIEAQRYRNLVAMALIMSALSLLFGGPGERSSSQSERTISIQRNSREFNTTSSTINQFQTL